jgi:hypothetical protein
MYSTIDPVKSPAGAPVTTFSPNKKKGFYLSIVDFRADRVSGVTTWFYVLHPKSYLTVNSKVALIDCDTLTTLFASK